MAKSATHKGWLFDAAHGILAAVLKSAKDGATVTVTNTAYDGLLVGTPVTPALAVNSMLISNQVADGDILIATQTGGNSQAYIWIDASAGTLNLYGAGTAAMVLSATALELEDNILMALGNDQDQAIINRSASLNADTAVTGVVVGTPVVAAIPANSLIVSNVTADGDQVFMGQTGGNSQEWLRYDASAKLVVINEDSGDVDFRIESNGNANMFVVDGGDNTVGIGGAAVANQTVTVTNATLEPIAGRLIKLSGSMAAANMADGYGMFEVDCTITGTMGATGFANAASAWVNIPSGTVGAGKYVCARNDGVYEDSSATITNAKIVFGARMHKILGDTDALSFPFSLNTNNTAITALFDVPTATSLGVVANAGTSAATLVPFYRDVNGTLKYVLLYDLQ